VEVGIQAKDLFFRFQIYERAGPVNAVARLGRNIDPHRLKQYEKRVPIHAASKPGWHPSITAAAWVGNNNVHQWIQT